MRILLVLLLTLCGCSRHLIELEDPHVGCPECAAENPGAEVVLQGRMADE